MTVTGGQQRRSDAGGRAGCMIVGVGAATPADEALRRVLLALPSDASIAVVVVAHAAPASVDRGVDDPFAGVALPVVHVHGGESLESGRIYVVPTGRDAYLENGVIHVHRGRKKCAEPIDAFFTSLAAHSEARGCGVLLSAVGGDGVQGLRELRGAGGLAFAVSAEDGSPADAALVGLADFTGSPEEIASELTRRSSDPRMSGLGAGAKRVSKDAKEREDRQLAAILELVRKESGIDFSGYKRTTVLRRIGRRAMLRDSQGLERYCALLEASTEELAALSDDLLVGVTSFFRDADVFEALRSKVLPKVVESAAARETSSKSNSAKFMPPRFARSWIWQ